MEVDARGADAVILWKVIVHMRYYTAAGVCQQRLLLAKLQDAWSNSLGSLLLASDTICYHEATIQPARKRPT
ncbi:hypothetical protein VTN02DRAFT_6433 [Thermoascus thermophilus]